MTINCFSCILHRLINDGSTMYGRKIKYYRLTIERKAADRNEGIFMKTVVSFLCFLSPYNDIPPFRKLNGGIFHAKQRRTEKVHLSQGREKMGGGKRGILQRAHQVL